MTRVPTKETIIFSMTERTTFNRHRRSRDISHFRTLRRITTFLKIGSSEAKIAANSIESHAKIIATIKRTSTLARAPVNKNWFDRLEEKCIISIVLSMKENQLLSRVLGQTYRFAAIPPLFSDL